MKQREYVEPFGNNPFIGASTVADDLLTAEEQKKRATNAVPLTINVQEVVAGVIAHDED